MPKLKTLEELVLRIYPEDQKTFGPCECCGEMTSRVWGCVETSEMAIATYFVEWTPGHEGRQANFDLIVGKWGEDTNASDRQAVAVEFRKLETGPAFRVIDISERNVGKSSLVSTGMNRDSVIGTPLADHVFAICDLVYLEDSRISELRD
jgi:hypothetical protein